MNRYSYKPSKRDKNLARSVDQAAVNISRRDNCFWIKSVDSKRRVYLRDYHEILNARLVNFLFTVVLKGLLERNFTKYGSAMNYISESIKHISKETWESLNASHYDKMLAKKLYRGLWEEAMSLHNRGVSSDTYGEVVATSGPNGTWVAEED